MNGSANGLGLGTVLFLIFLVLKLTGNIDWSWWWVTSPLWISFLLFLIVLAVALFGFNRAHKRINSSFDSWGKW